jgi:DNA-binding MarR family transcriptional regulator
MSSRASPPPADPATLANGLHSAAIHLLRRLRREDDASGLSAPLLSALSVVYFSGGITVTELAAAEQVRAPTMTRVVQDLEAAGLVKRVADASDGRVSRIRATAKGERIMKEGRSRRVHALEAELKKLTAKERSSLAEGVQILTRVVDSLRS